MRPTGYVGLLSGAGYGIVAGVFTVYCYPQLFPDILILPIYAAVLYGILGLVVGLLLGALLNAYRRLFGNSPSRQSTSAIIVACVATIFLILTRLDSTALPGQLSFLKNWHSAVNALFFLGTFGVVFLLARGVFRLAPSLVGDEARLRVCIVPLIAVYVFGIAFFAWLHEGRASENQALADASRFQDMMEEVKDTKIFLIGVDGASWKILQPLVDEGKVPNFARLMREGVYGPLRTRKPTNSPVIWSTIGSGKTEEKHNVRDFVYLKIPLLSNIYWDYLPFLFQARRVLDGLGVDPIPVTSDIRQCKMFWHILNDLQISVGMVGWWPSWPADPVIDFMVTERFFWDYINETVVYPDGLVAPDTLLEEAVAQVTSVSEFDQQRELLRFVALSDDQRGQLSQRINQVQIGALADEQGAPDDILQTALSYLGWLYQRDLNKVNVGLHLYDRFQPQVFALYLKSVDPVQHAFWRWTEPEAFDDVDDEHLAFFKNTVREYYMYTDELLGEVLQRADANTLVMVVSDHGFTAQPEGRFWQSGNHTDAPGGVVILAGPGVKRGDQITSASILDITPTLLYALRLPVADDMDGRALVEAFESEHTATHPVETIATYESYDFSEASGTPSTTSDKKFIEHLKSLGYIK